MDKTLQIWVLKSNKVKYLAMHSANTCWCNKQVYWTYGLASIWAIIHSLKLNPVVKKWLLRCKTFVKEIQYFNSHLINIRWMFSKLVAHWGLIIYLLIFCTFQCVFQSLGSSNRITLHNAHVWTQKDLSEGKLWQVFVCLCGEGGTKYHNNQTIIGPPAKYHLMACRWWHNLVA